MRVITREPSSLSSPERIRLGDVGYICTGGFYRLFSAGCSLGGRILGRDVPLNFKKLQVGHIVERAPLTAGHRYTDGVRATEVTPVAPTSPPLTSPTSASSSPAPPSYVHSVASVYPGILDLYSRTSGSTSTVSFQLTGGRGAALLTNYPAYREDAPQTGTFEKYTKEHYASWVEFAREAGLGDVNPILITGVDRTKDFAMFCYSSDHDGLECEFTKSSPGVASGGWTWRNIGSVYTNHGPQLRRPPSPTQTAEPTSSGDVRTGTTSSEDEYNQSVFVRYITMRRRLGVPRVIRAAAGPCDPGRRGCDGEGSPLQAEYDSDSDLDSDSDAVSSLLDDDDDGWSSATSVGSESDIVIHNPTVVRYSLFPSPTPIFSHPFNPLQDGRDDFDVIADYVFQVS